MKANDKLKTWRFFAILWPFMCVLFIGIIICAPGRNMEERICDTFFALIPLIFFAIGMSMRRRLLKERRYATALTKAFVVSEGLRIQPGKRNFFPEFEFRAGESTYRVQYTAGYSFHIVSTGEEVDLYYNPQNPRIFYVPAVQKHDNRLSLLLCGVGVVWPLLGLFAPLYRPLFSY